MEKGIIYKVTCKVNHKCYIGKTIKTLEQRKKQHLNYNNNKLLFQRALKKYGQENFLWEILEVVNKNNLNNREKYFIKLFNSDRIKGYNMTPGGEGGNINKNNPNKKEMYKKIAYKNSGNNNYINKLDEKDRQIFINNYRKGKNNPMYNKKHKPETLLLMSEKHKGENNGFYNKKHTKLFKKQQSITMKGKNVGENNGMFNKFGELHPKSKKYIITTKDGKEIKVTGLNQISSHLNLYPQALSSCATGKLNHTKGYKCRFA